MMGENKTLDRQAPLPDGPGLDPLRSPLLDTPDTRCAHSLRRRVGGGAPGPRGEETSLKPRAALAFREASVPTRAKPLFFSHTKPPAWLPAPAPAPPPAKRPPFPETVPLLWAASGHPSRAPKHQQSNLGPQDPKKWSKMWEGPGVGGGGLGGAPGGRTPSFRPRGRLPTTPGPRKEGARRVPRRGVRVGDGGSVKTRVRGPGMREDRGERPETKRWRGARPGRGSEGGERRGCTDGTGWVAPPGSGVHLGRRALSGARLQSRS